MKASFPIIVTLLSWLIVACTGIETITTQEVLLSKTGIQNVETASTSTIHTKTPVDSIATSTKAPMPLLTVVESRTVVKVPISTEVNSFFVDHFDVQGKNWNVNIGLLNLFYEESVDGNLVLNTYIQCNSEKSQCEQWMSRWAFFFAFANPEPQPGDLAFFPKELTGFKVFCYDKDMILVDSFAGNWSDILLYEQELIPDDVLERRLFQP